MDIFWGLGSLRNALLRVFYQKWSAPHSGPYSGKILPRTGGGLQQPCTPHAPVLHITSPSTPLAPALHNTCLSNRSMKIPCSALTRCLPPTARLQVVLQKAKARLAEAEEFAKRQAKRAEQKVEQSLELQALEHKMIREQTRIDNELRLLQKEAELVAKQEEMEAKRLSLARAIQERENLEADVAAYKLTTEARALRERVNQQTLVDTVMKNLGKPMEGSRILTINGGSGAAGQEGGNTGSMAMLPQMVALKEILGQCNELDRQAPHAPLPSSGYGSHISSSSHGRQ